ncbi:peptidase family M50-domain-containing protein [Cristinia sonorae]|uniref:Endopeptidase S2P n=1 Tax=Cristinia sonorae TaxID=1940300 RepID=A0A8K0UKL5_9AGAR|nr:peptidase family M50-domain-containing protein [Cristinia sonorae]
MGVESLFLSLSLFWAIIYFLHHSWTQRHPRAILPVPTDGRRKYQSTRVTLYRLSLRVEYPGWNQLHDELTSALRRSKRFGRTLSRCYDLGSLVCVAGMVAGLYLLCALTIQLCYSTLVSPKSEVTGSLGQGPSNHRLFKRDTPSELVSQRHNVPASPVHLLIPGLTVPLWHLTPLMFALFVCQIIHEAGHALAAAIDAVPLLSVGAAFTVAIPSAFVALSSATMQQLSPKSRLRVVSAGAAHNLIFWALLVLFSYVGLDSLCWSLAGYDHVGLYARVVSGIHSESPLRAYLPVGELITHLNDKPLASATEDIWATYLAEQQEPHRQAELGWCAGLEWFEAQSSGCCKIVQNSTTGGLSCFRAAPSSHSPLIERCLSPHYLVSGEHAEIKQRCNDDLDCGGAHVCVRPISDEEILRIRVWIPPYMRSASSKQEEVVIWSGPWDEVLEDVEVSMYYPRYGFLPLWFPSFVNAFFGYLSSLSLSLYFFNLLPLSFLDGGQFLDALLDLFRRSDMLNRNEFQLDALEAGITAGINSQPGAMSPMVARWKGIVLKGASAIVTCLICLCGLCGVFNYIR